MVIPGILEKDWEEIERKINICREFSNTIHIDFIDGKFFPNITFFDPEKFKEVSRDLALEAHLMVEEPIKYLDSLSSSGFRRFLGHIEKMSSQTEFIAMGEKFGEVGLALDLETQIDAINIPLLDLDAVLLMATPAGQSGLTFQGLVIDKIKNLRSKFLGTIEVDGGINDQTILFAKTSGAQRFVCTSYLFESEDPKKRFQTLKGLV
ncbi:MAG: hypothetical protein AAB801_02415 [Patescibacteria group bacterium]